MHDHDWSPFQLAVFADVATGTGHTVVNACAGSGKTTVLVEAISHVPPGLSTLFVAFNKAIAEELARRLSGKPVEVSTLHSYGLRTVTAGLGRLRIHKYRVGDFLREALGDEPETMQLRRSLEKAVSLAKGVLAQSRDDVDGLLDAFGIEVPALMDREVFVDHAVRTLDRCRDTSDGCLDFDDMVWLPIVHGLRQRQYDRVFVDERQDLHAAQVEMVLRAVKPSGRICAVGDRFQSVYSFRGADAQAFERAAAALGAKELPLSISYRCSRAVVAHVRKVLPEIPIQAAPDAPEGEVVYASRDRMEHPSLGAQSGDFILSRGFAY